MKHFSLIPLACSLTALLGGVVAYGQFLSAESNCFLPSPVLSVASTSEAVHFCSVNAEKEQATQKPILRQLIKAPIQVSYIVSGNAHFDERNLQKAENYFKKRSKKKNVIIQASKPKADSIEPIVLDLNKAVKQKHNIAEVNPQNHSLKEQAEEQMKDFAKELKDIEMPKQNFYEQATPKQFYSEREASPKDNNSSIALVEPDYRIPD